MVPSRRWTLRCRTRRSSACGRCRVFVSASLRAPVCRYITVTLYTVVKSSGLIWNFVFSAALGLVRPSVALGAAVAGDVVGIVLASVEDASFDGTGFALALAASVVHASRWAMTVRARGAPVLRTLEFDVRTRAQEKLFMAHGARASAIEMLYWISLPALMALVPAFAILEAAVVFDSRVWQDPLDGLGAGAPRPRAW